eukprot:12892915-Prorocentrum_lima.AAC.1
MPRVQPKKPCPFEHPEDATGRRFMCGSTIHVAKDCTRPRFQDQSQPGTPYQVSKAGIAFKDNEGSTGPG